MLKPTKFVKIALVASLTALAIPLWFFKIPYPLATFLKFDLVGVPYTIAMLLSTTSSLLFTPILFIVFLYFNPDVIAISMKIIAELVTALPLSYVYRRLERKRNIVKAVVIASATAMVSRVVIMAILNYLIAPHWIVWTYKWNFDAAYKWTVTFLIPVNLLFNAICVAYIAPSSLATYRIIKRLGIE